MLYNKIAIMYRCLYCMKQFSTKQYTETHSKNVKKEQVPEYFHLLITVNTTLNTVMMITST